MADAQTTRARPSRAPSGASISMRVARASLDLIDNAASVLGQTRTEFMLESARRQAVETLCDQRVFQLDPDASAAFMAVLDDPPPPNAALKALLARKAPWEA